MNEIAIPVSKIRRARPVPKGRPVDPVAREEIARVLEGAPRESEYLIENLHRVQDAFGSLSAAHLNALAEAMRLAATAREGKATRTELSGSTITVTSLGALGGVASTPIINYPEVGILYVPQIKQKPVVKNGQIVVGNVMNLGVSFDHRVIDGYTGASFVQDLADFLQDPDRLLLQMR